MIDRSNPIDALSAPIPGESLTLPKGATAYEQPPRFTDPNDVLSFLWNEMTKQRRQTQIIGLLKNGAPAEALARINLFQGAAKGYFTFDMALSVANTVHQMIVSIGQRAVANGLLKPDELKIHTPDTEMEDFMRSMSGGLSVESIEEISTEEEASEEPDILGGL